MLAQIEGMHLCGASSFAIERTLTPNATLIPHPKTTMKRLALSATLCLIFLPISAATSAELSYPVTSGGPTQDAVIDNTPVSTAFSFNVTESFTLTGVRLRFSATHQFMTDISVKLVSPAGTEVILFDKIGASAGILQNTYFADLVIRDDAVNALGEIVLPDPPGPNFNKGPWSGELKPESPAMLSAFSGEGSVGTWQLVVLDDLTGDTGYVYAAGDDSNAVPDALASRFGIALGTELTLTTDNLPALTPIAQWRLAKFGSPANSGIGANSADPDFDASPNILEYALDRDPLSGDGADGNAGLPEESVASSLGIVIDLPNPAPTDILYEVRGGSGLNTSIWTVGADKSGTGSWNVDPGDSLTTGAVIDGRQIVEISIAGYSFMHLRVSEIVAP